MADQAEHRSLREVIKSADKLATMRQEMENLRAQPRREWALNREFYKGNQWIWWNRWAGGGGRIESLGTEEGEKPRYKVRMTSNQILPGVNHFVALQTKTRPQIQATPDSGADKDIKAAQMATRLYDYWWDEFGLKAQLVSALTHAAISQGYWKISWDPLAGKQLKILMDPEGNPVDPADEDLADVYREQLEQLGQQAGIDLLSQFEQTFYVGDIRVETMPGENVLLYPSGVQRFEDATGAVCVHYMDPDEIEARWPKGKDLQPDAITDDTGIPLSFTGSQDGESQRNTRQVFIGYFRPSPILPKGRYVVWVEGPNKILAESDWQFPFNELPLVKFPGFESPSSAMDIPVVSNARGLNKELNAAISKGIEHRNLTMNPQMLAPTGSLRERLTTEPGIAINYNPLNNLKPEWRDMPALPAWFFEQMRDIQQRLDMVFMRIPSQRDQLPARIDGGSGIEMIQEAVADQLSPIIERLEMALARAGNQMVALAHEFYEEERLLKIRGSAGAVQVQKFMSSDLDGGYSFHAVAGSGLPRNRAAKQQQVMELLGAQLISPGEALRALDLGSMNSIEQKLQADEEQALREHDRLLRGQPLNEMALQMALEAVQAGANPETGEPIKDDAEAEGILQKASLSPWPYENKSAHLDTHSNYMKTLTFERLPAEVKQQYIQHFILTAEALQAEQPQQQELPNVNLALKGTTSASVAAAILNKAGVEVSEDQVAEPPLETWVTDSMDKPDMDEAGNDPLTQQEQMMAMEQAAQKHALNLAKTAHEVSLAEARAVDSEHATDRSNDERAQAADHAEEKHQLELAHAEEKHQEQLKTSAAQRRQQKEAKPSDGNA